MFNTKENLNRGKEKYGGNVKNNAIPSDIAKDLSESQKEKAWIVKIGSLYGIRFDTDVKPGDIKKIDGDR
jgi:hypothetical protein